MKEDEEKYPQTISISRLHRPFSRIPTRPLKKKDVTTPLIVFFSFLFVGALLFVREFDASAYRGVSSRTTKKPITRPQFPLQCTAENMTQTCPTIDPRKENPQEPGTTGHPSNVTCPSYFRWIHEDLRHWRETGITSEMIERARRTAHFRLVIVDGKAYVENYRPSIQTRAEFTLWGIVQLLRWHPGRLPDLDLMFDCDDRPVIRSEDFRGPNSGPPPLFRYCSDPWSLDIVFPDWSFWGWAEINMRPWKNVLEDVKEGNKRTEWKDRVPFAYWRGNPNVSPIRQDLLKCNVTDKDDWNTRLYIQDWDEESKQGYKQSNIRDQCTHRYKIYVEGWAWSVSEKYILACDSMTLYVSPHFYDFYIRGMVPLQHYWPIRENTKCTSLKFAVEWANNHTKEAEDIGKAASKFIIEDMNMDYVYDYMFNLLNAYAKLLKFKPTVPPGAVELCSETMACPRNGTHKKFMVESLVMSPTDAAPCTMPPPYDPEALREFLDNKAKSIEQVEAWENEYWQSPNKDQ